MSLNEMSKNITKLDAGSRANYLESIGPLKNAFDDKGNVKSNAIAKDLNQEAVSSNIRAVSGVVKYAPVKSSEVVSEGAKTVKSTVEKTIGEGANVVITNEEVAGDALYNPDEDIIYVNNKANINQEAIAKAVALHEVTHTTEGTKAYYELMKTLDEIARDEKTPQEVLDIIGDVRLRKFKTTMLYGDDLEGRSEKAGEYIIDTEVSADLMGDLLGNDYFIEKLAHRNDSLVKKIYHSIVGLIKTKNADLSKDSIRYLNKLASKFGKAIDNRRGGVKLSDIGAMDDEREGNELGNVDNESNERYNRISFLHKNFPGEKETWSEAHRLAVWWARRPDVETGDQTLISMNDRWYLVEKFDDAENNYQVEEYLSKTKVKSIFKEINENGYIGKIKSILSTSNGYDSDNSRNQIFIGGEPGAISPQIEHGGKGSKMVRLDRVETDRRERLTSDRDGDSESSSKNRQGNRALKDSQGNQLTDKQAEYFANSKVRDKDGNLLVVYHGTENDFNIFKSNSGFNEFFFTDSIEASKDYGSKTKTVYLNLENPYVIDYEGGFDKQILDDIDYAKSKGYDGVIALNTFDGANTHNQYVAFKKNQIKNITNKTPTGNPDIRYSKRATWDELGIDFVKDENGGLRIVSNDLELAQKLEENRKNKSYEAKLEAAEEQRKESLRGLIGEEFKKEESYLAEVTRLRKYIANNMLLKKYDSKDAIAIIDELMGIVELADEKNPVFAKLKGKKQAEVKRMLIDALNTKEPGERNGAALDIARYLIYNTTITDAYESS